ncbi:hypothetical protein J2S58_001168 [Nakamurella flavida]|nr:hypothetical protein [Nakamurella flavida]MDP9777545.1 hypothetical protein [Nakamurella flavida]
MTSAIAMDRGHIGRRHARTGRLRSLVVSGALVLAGLVVTPAPPAGAETPGDALAAAVSAAGARGVTSFVSVVDRATGQVVAQTPNAGAQVASESIMKLMLAAYYLTLYGGADATPQSVKDRLSFMLRFSDDDTASSLFTASAIPTIAGRYGLSATTNATDRVGHWGAARITAADMTTFLSRAAGDPQVGPWLLSTMAQTARTGSGSDAGFDQFFGLNALSGEHGSKQGWGCDSFFTAPSCAVHSVGYTDRFFVAVLQLSTGYPDPMRSTATDTARRLQAATVVQSPVGSFDLAGSVGVGQLRVAGWAADPEEPGAVLPVHVYVTGPAGTAGTALSTGGSRPDVAAVIPGAGGATGFDGTVRTQGAGPNQVCAFAIGSAANTLLGCRTVDVRDAFGSLDAVGLRGDEIVAGGWAIDPNNPGSPTQVHVYDSGPGGTRGYAGFLASSSRPDLAGFGAGDAHGYNAAVPANEPGPHTVCAYAITTGGGDGNPLLGCRTITVPGAFGALDDVRVAGGSITVYGWAVNGRDPGGRVPVHVYDTGPSGTVGYGSFGTGTPRPDVAAAFPGVGVSHGYFERIPVRGRGQHTVCAFAVPGGQPSVLLGCRDVSVP